MACQCECHWKGCVEDVGGRNEKTIIGIELEIFFAKNPRARALRKEMLHVAERIDGFDWSAPTQEVYEKLYRIARSWDGHSRVRG